MELKVTCSKYVTIYRIENGALVVMKINRQEYEKTERIIEALNRRMNHDRKRKDS